jgi:hypothetical protein
MKDVLGSLKHWIVVLAGAAFGIYWFCYNLSLPIELKGLTCCDAGEYATLARRSDVWDLTTQRTFGYPLFLRPFFLLHQSFGDTDAYAWTNSAAIAQMALWMISVTVFFYALRSTDRKYPWWLLGLAFAQPALSSYAALMLTDVPATSFFCLSLACIINIQNRGRYMWLSALLAGVFMGIATTMRPSFQVISFATPVLLGWSLWIQGRRERTSRLVLTRAALLVVIPYLIGFTPLYAKILSNCTKQFGQLCIFEPGKFVAAQKLTTQLGLSHSRMASSVLSGFKGTGDSFLDRLAVACRTSLGSLNQSSDPNDGYRGIDWLVKCLMHYPGAIMPLVIKKAVGGFDNYFLNAYATDQTTEKEFYFNHIFSVFGFLGFFGGLLHFFRCVWARTLARNLHLLIALAYVAFQCLVHVETRYFFPVYIPLMLFFFSSLTSVLSQNWPRRVLFLAFNVVLAAGFFVQTRIWNLTDCLMTYDRIAPELRGDGIFRTCPPQESVREDKLRTEAWLPTWPSPRSE